MGKQGSFLWGWFIRKKNIENLVLMSLYRSNLALAYWLVQLNFSFSEFQQLIRRWPTPVAHVWEEGGETPTTGKVNCHLYCTQLGFQDRELFYADCFIGAIVDALVKCVHFSWYNLVKEVLITSRSIEWVYSVVTFIQYCII